MSNIKSSTGCSDPRAQVQGLKAGLSEHIFLLVNSDSQIVINPLRLRAISPHIGKFGCLLRFPYNVFFAFHHM